MIDAGLTLTRVKYKNVMSIGAQPCDIVLNDHKKTLIIGKNGASKSTMIEAIFFGLFGKPFRDIKLDLLINSINAKELLVELWLTKDNKEYHIKRGLKPAVFEIYIDGELLDKESSTKQYQQTLENLLEISPMIFKQVVILGTAGYKPFLTLTAAERRAFVESILGLTDIAAMDKANKDIVRELNQSIKITNMKIGSTEDKIKTLTKVIQDAEAAATKKPEVVDNTALIATIENDKSELESILNEIKELKPIVDENKAKLPSILDKIEDTNSKLSKLNAALAVVKADTARTSKLVTLYTSGGNCPTCHQDLSNGDINKAKCDLDGLTVKGDKISELHSRLTDELKADSILRDQLKESIQPLQVLIDKAQRLKYKITTDESTLESRSKPVTQSSIDTTPYKNDLQLAKSDLAKLLAEASNVNQELYRRGLLTEMLKDSGVKAIVMAKYMPYINSCIKKYLEMMNASYEFRLDESFNESSRSRGHEKFTYNSFSEGEKSRIDLAFLFTWRDVRSMISGIKLNNLIMDEVFDGSLDDDGVRNVHAIIDDLKIVNACIISHKEHDINAYDRLITMSKPGMFSRCEIQDLASGDDKVLKIIDEFTY